MIKLSYSGLSTFQRCPRMYRHRYISKRVPLKTSDSLALGSFVHGALEAFWLAVMAGNDPHSAAAWWCIDNADTIDGVEAAKASAMLASYDPPASYYEVLGVEVPFEMKVRNPATGRAMRGVRVMGYVDGLLRNRATGEIVVLEHKTTSDQILGFGPFWSRLNIDAQVAIYSLAFNTSTVIYDVLRKPLLRPSKADRAEAERRLDLGGIGRELTDLDIHEAYAARVGLHLATNTDEFYQWRPIPISPAEAEVAETNLLESIKMLRHSKNNELYPCNSGGCRMYGVCPYLDVCCGRADLNDDALFGPKGER